MTALHPYRPPLSGMSTNPEVKATAMEATPVTVAYMSRPASCIRVSTWYRRPSRNPSVVPMVRAIEGVRQSRKHGRAGAHGYADGGYTADDGSVNGILVETIQDLRTELHALRTEKIHADINYHEFKEVKEKMETLEKRGKPMTINILSTGAQLDLPLDVELNIETTSPIFSQAELDVATDKHSAYRPEPTCAELSGCAQYIRSGYDRHTHDRQHAGGR